MQKNKNPNLVMHQDLTFLAHSRAVGWVLLPKGVRPLTGHPFTSLQRKRGSRAPLQGNRRCDEERSHKGILVVRFEVPFHRAVHAM